MFKFKRMSTSLKNEKIVVSYLLGLCLLVISCSTSNVLLEPPVYKNAESELFNLVQKEGKNSGKVYRFLDSLVLDLPEGLNSIMSMGNPQKWDSLYHPEINRLIVQIKKEEDFQKQKKLIRELLEYPDAHSAFAKGYYWQENQQVRYWKKLVEAAYLPFGNKNSSSITRVPVNNWIKQQKNPKVLERYRDYVIEAWQKGKPNSMYFQPNLGLLVAATLNIKKDKFHASYQEIIDKCGEEAALWIIQTLGSQINYGFTPMVVVNCLKHENPEIVDKVISWIPNMRDAEKRELIRQYQLDIFHGDNEPLKFHVCFPLMYKYQERLAIDYLLEQTKSEDLQRKRRAIGWLGDACNSNRKMTPEMHEILKQHLTHPDLQIQRAIVDTYTTYNGELVIESIIPFLNHDFNLIRNRVERKLKKNRNPEMVLKILNEYLIENPNTELEGEIRNIISEIEK